MNLSGWRLSAVALGLFLFSFSFQVPKAQAITCGFGSDIGGECRGYLTSAVGNQTFTSPSDWNNASNTIECIGGGGGGQSDNTPTNWDGGGGGGAYAKISNFSFSIPGTSVATYQVGAGGTGLTNGLNGNSASTTYFNASSDPGNGTDNSKCGAAGGEGGGIGPSNNYGIGGQTTSSWGQTKYAGGDGGHEDATLYTATGGGGAGGPNGAGNNGVSQISNSATNGGSGDAGSGGSPGSGNTGTGAQTGGDGVAGTEWDASHGSGGGGGGAYVSSSGNATGGNGGNYGAGGGSAQTASGTAKGGNGSQGIIVITYTPTGGGGGGTSRTAMFEFWGGFFRMVGGRLRII